ncbi:MFS transporter [Rhizobium sp. KVB221]|uniref:MFS transporter n=1 Tax=Rhizobium setariae TaxID=2801340 RepID=A0A936YUD1_9HYPH|nr:MFS transporter [Rhizobium setariae]MBL0372750.1 MFS transporter [Rhizobium setariae]
MSKSAVSATREEAPRLFALRAALLFCAPMMVNGIGLPYFPWFLDYLEMSAAEIGIILAVPHLVRMIGTPLGAVAADRAKDRSHVLLWSAAISLLTAVTLFYTHSFWAVLIVYALQGIFYAPYVPIAEAILITGVRRWNFDYGFLRLWGSVAFILSTLLGGWLFGLFGGAMVVPAMAGFFLLTVVMAIVAPRLGRAPAAEAHQGLSAERNPLWQPEFVLVTGGAALVQGSHSMLFTFASIYWEKQLGFSGIEISWFWTAGVIAEIVLFLFASRLLSRFSIWALILTGCMAAVARWIVFPHIDGFWPHFALQCSHAFTFAIIHIGIQRFIMERVGERQEASAQGFYTTYIALFTAIVTLLSGYIYGSLGIQGFYIMAVLAAVGALMVFAAMIRQPQRTRSGG